MATSVHALIDESTFDAEGRPGLTYRRARGVRVVLEWIARRLLTPRDSLPWALGVGIDLAGYINAALTPKQIKSLQTECDLQVSKVEYVSNVRSTMVLERDGTLRYRVTVKIADAGTFPLAISIDRAAKVLAQFPIAA